MRLTLVLLCQLAIAGCGPTHDAPAVPALPGWTLTWHDEFEGALGTPPDPTKWNHTTGGNGFGNDELQYHTNRPANAALDGNGALAITARKERFTDADGTTRQYTSARVRTEGHFAQAYGRFEARMKLPRGQGLWPAFWLLGSDHTTAGWPRSGEIDIMEYRGHLPSTVLGTVHGPGYSGSRGVSKTLTLPAGQTFADDFHVFALEWEPSSIRWFVDGQLFHSVTPADIPSGQRWVFNHPFFVILNVAVGGRFPGNPDETTVFPQVLLVDYVRVYARTTTPRT